MSTEQLPENQEPKPAVLSTIDTHDIAENKILASLAYIGILFIVPLIAAKKSPYARFHTSQGFVIFLGWLLLALVSWIPILGWLIGIFGTIFLIILSIMGVAYALSGKTKKLPLVGNFNFLDG